MSVSKKIRFEVFKRDGFQCAYCGKSPPEVSLECDHIEPVSKGGSDELNNLLTACFACNRGKSDIPLDKAPSTLSDNLEVLQEKEAQLAEYRKFTKKIRRRVTRDTKEINDIFMESFPKQELTSLFRKRTVAMFLKSLTLSEVAEAMEIACDRVNYADAALKYFCGVCWKKIRGDGNEKTQ